MVRGRFFFALYPNSINYTVPHQVRLTSNLEAPGFVRFPWFPWVPCFCFARFPGSEGHGRQWKALPAPWWPACKVACLQGGPLSACLCLFGGPRTQSGLDRDLIGNSIQELHPGFGLAGGGGGGGGAAVRLVWPEQWNFHCGRQGEEKETGDSP